MVNTGNSCYLNSILQALTYTPALSNYLYSDEHVKTCQKKANHQFCPLCVMQSHVKKAQNSGGEVVPDFARRYLKQIHDSLKPGRQEDAHEFLRMLVEQLAQASDPKLQSMGTRNARIRVLTNNCFCYLSCSYPIPNFIVS